MVLNTADFATAFMFQPLSAKGRAKPEVWRNLRLFIKKMVKDVPLKIVQSQKPQYFNSN
jgi:hypothetical protein